MRINTSQISMDASTEHRDVTGRAGLISRGGDTGEEEEFRLRLPGMPGFVQERVEANRQGQEVCATSSVRCPEGERTFATSAEQVMEQLTSEISGQRIRVRRINGMENSAGLLLSEPVNPPGTQVGFSFVSQSTHYEYERISVHSAGSVRLEDGREIDFSLELNMERESFVQDSVVWQAAGGILMDPITLNFDCDLRSLSNRMFQFDMNSDGEADILNSLKPGTGFLALDLNGDEQINNGRELFGPTTGHGFTELAVHDADLNGWIDENDRSRIMDSTSRPT